MKSDRVQLGIAPLTKQMLQTPQTIVACGVSFGCTKENPRLCRGEKEALAESKEIKRIPQQSRSGLPTTHLQQRGIPTDNLGQYRLQKCQDREILCPFRGGRAVNADARCSVHLQMLASKMPFQGLIKPPAQPEVMTEYLTHKDGSVYIPVLNK